MTIGEFLTQYVGAFFGFLGAALAAGLACVGSAKGTGRFSQARIMPRRTFCRSKLWRLPSFLMTTMGRLSTVS